MKRIKGAVASLIFLLGGCGGAEPQDYKNETPVFDLPTYLNGEVEAWGILQDYSTKVKRRFYVHMDASWQGDVGTLNERFVFNDGEKTTRIWTIKKTGEHSYTGTAGDVIGTAEGERYGNTLRWNYVLRVPVGDTTYDLTMDDWMYLLDDRILVNKTKMKKFGLQVGELTIFFRKLKDGEQADGTALGGGLLPEDKTHVAE